MSHATDIITSATLPPWLTYEIHAQIPDEGGAEMAAANVATCDCHFIITCNTYLLTWDISGGLIDPMSPPEMAWQPRQTADITDTGHGNVSDCT